jgi:molybdenum storage protein
MVVERVVIEYLTRSRYCSELQIINGTIPGMLTRALEGENVGTVITRD